MTIQGPFYNLKEAALYCGYKPVTFARLIREYALPKSGPRKNRFAASVLDAWMASPDTFKIAPPPLHLDAASPNWYPFSVEDDHERTRKEGRTLAGQLSRLMHGIFQ